MKSSRPIQLRHRPCATVSSEFAQPRMSRRVTAEMVAEDKDSGGLGARVSEWWGGSSAAAIRSFVRSKEAVRRRTHTGPYRRRQKRRRRCWQLNWLTEHSSGSSSGECARSVIYSGWEGGL